MSPADAVRSQLLRLTRAVPFRPFVLGMADGGSVRIDRPESLAYDPDPGGADEFRVFRGTLRLSGRFADVTAVYPAASTSGPVRWGTAIALPVAGLLLGSSVGVATNAVNAAVSTPYYTAVLGLYGDDDASRRAVILLHGTVEGGILGLLFGVTFAVAAAASTRLRVPVRTALPTLLLAVGVAVVCWAVGGAVGLTWAGLDPAAFEAAFPPSRGLDNEDLCRFGWVGGSIWGAYAGAAVAAVVGCVHLHRRWRAAVRRTTDGGGGFPITAT